MSTTHAPSRPHQPGRALQMVPRERMSGVVGTSAECHGRAPVSMGNVHEAPQPGNRPGDGAAFTLRCILHRALEEASRGGVKRITIATKLGVSERTLESWVVEGRYSSIPAHHLIVLCIRRDVLPEAARARLVREIAGAMNARVVNGEACNADESPIGEQMCEVVEALGASAGAIGTIVDGGVNAAEAKATLPKVRELERQVIELRMTLEGVEKGDGRGE